MVPYEKLVLHALKDEADKSFVIPFPYRAFLTKLAIQEDSGASINTTVDVFSRNPTLFEDEFEETVYKVCPTQALNNGSMLVFLLDYTPYVNQDVETLMGTRENFVYIRINGSDEGTFSFAVAGYSALD